MKAGQTASFSVTANGAGTLSYQWQKNGANITGANASTWTTPPTTGADDGSQFSVTVSGSGGSVQSGMATLHVIPAAPIITQQPSSTSVAAGQAAAFTVSVTGYGPFTYQWQRNGAPITGANSASYTTPATSLTDNGAQFSVVVTGALNLQTQSNSATLTVTPAPAALHVLTYHNDNARTGQNLSETILSPANVSSATFGLVGFLPVQGLVDAEPLYVSQLTVNGALHDVVFVVTEHDMAYAFDADSLALLWQTSLLGSGETTSDDRDCEQIVPEIGITATPAIDLAAGPAGVMYLVAMSKDGSGHYYQRLHALDITKGTDVMPPVAVQGSYPTLIGQTTFDPGQYAERAGLLVMNGSVYLAWTSHCDLDPYTGWVMAYSEANLQQTSVVDVTPNGSEGAIWMAGDGLAADAAGYIYFLDGNGTFDTTLNAQGFPTENDFGNAFIKLSSTSGLAVADYFAMYAVAEESGNDIDLGSGGVLLLPDLADATGTTRHLAVGAGKDGYIYVVDRDSMGKYNPYNNNGAYQAIAGASPSGVWSMPAYFNGTVYYAAVDDTLKAFPLSNALLASTPASLSSAKFAYPGATPGISANGSTGGIVWAVENGFPGGILHAYDATNLGKELYNSNQAGTRDRFSDNKFITPMIAHGKVYVGTPTGVAVFGLLNTAQNRSPAPTRQDRQRH